MDPTRGKLCLLALSICNSNDNADCYECMNKKKICNIHEQVSDNGNGHCNLVYVVHENIENGSYGQSYSLEVFTEDSVSQIPEFETKFSTQIIVDSNKRKGRYNRLPKNRGIDAIRNVKPRDSLEFFIKEAILTTSYCNGLLVGQGNSYLPFIFNALKYFNIEPKLVLRKNQKIIRIEINENNLTFLIADMFLHTSFKTILQDLEDPIFFPTTINCKSLMKQRIFQ